MMVMRQEAFIDDPNDVERGSDTLQNGPLFRTNLVLFGHRSLKTQEVSM